MWGFLSLLDAVFSRNIEDVLKEFNLDDEIREAVLKKTGVLGLILRTILDYERDNILIMEKHFNKLGINNNVFNEVMLDSFNYACNIGLQH